MKKGFTLLELLVVVLIIGILSGIALPQYQVARDKARLARYEILVKDIANAVRRNSLARDTWDYTFQELDIELPGLESTMRFSQSRSHGDIAKFDWGYCYIIEPSPGWTDSDVFCGGYDLVGYVQTIQFGTGEDTFTPYCVSSKDNPRGIKLCETFGETFTWGCFFGPNSELVCQAKASQMN